MNQKLKLYKSDLCTRTDILKKIEALAQSYTPEWRFSQTNPDIGSVIALIFANQMEENKNRYHHAIYEYHTEFVNMLGVSLLPANPACVIVHMSLAEDTIPGTIVPKGTKLFTQAQGEAVSVTFETMNNVYITNTKLSDIFMVNARTGCMKPILGEFMPISYIKAEEENDEGLYVEENKLKPFALFSFKEKGIEKNALLFYHSQMIDVENNPITIQIEGNERLLEGIKQGSFQFLYYSQTGLLPVEEYEVYEDHVVIIKYLPNQKVLVEGREYSILILEAQEQIEQDISVESITFTSEGKQTEPDYMGDASRECEKERCLPFGSEIALYKEFYIGHQGYFAKPGSFVTLSFQMEWEERLEGMTYEEEEAQLKPIKRKPKNSWSDTPAHTWPEEIVIEYYNGAGWKRLHCQQETKKLFAPVYTGLIKLTFCCPEDICAVEVGSYEGPCLRMQIIRADNCYLRPCIHHFPVLKDVQVSYSYEFHGQKPEKCIAIIGTKEKDFTKEVIEGKKFPAFSASTYSETALYLGFDKKFEEGPISLFYELEDHINFEGMGLHYEYSTIKGFKPLKKADHTGRLTSSGTVMFMPPADMTAITLEGKRRYWLKIVPYESDNVSEYINFPMINNIYLNGIECLNIDTLEEEDFYMDEVLPNRSFYLHTAHILEAEVWVNESESYTQEQMKQMAVEMGESVRLERDFLGNIASFFVKWEEVSGFHLSKPNDRHYILDRMNSKLIFGDGIHVMIPKIIDDIAFKVKVSCCNGQAGNVDAGQVNDAMTNMLFIDTITNPLKAFGGSDIETVGHALERGGNILSGRRRLISEYDYTREILAFSNHIDKVKCITGVLENGTLEEHALYIVLLMKDYKNGSYSFHKEQERLLKHLHTSCELSATEDDIHIVEPLFLKVSVEVWLEVPTMDDSFEIQTLFENSLEEYLEPISKAGGSGWKIGVLPTYSQILMKLNTLKSKAIVERMSAVVQYRDKMGIHETDLSKMKDNPYVICCNGIHKMHIQISGHGND